MSSEDLKNHEWIYAKKNFFNYAAHTDRAENAMNERVKKGQKRNDREEQSEMNKINKNKNTLSSVGREDRATVSWVAQKT